MISSLVVSVSPSPHPRWRPTRCWPLDASGGQCRPIWTGRRFGGDRFSCSMPVPATSSRHLNTGHHQGGGQGCPLVEGHALGAPLSRGSVTSPGFDAVSGSFDASAVVSLMLVFSSHT